MRTNENAKIVLFGTGYEGEKFIYDHTELKSKIAFCIDNYHTGCFHELPIVSLDAAGNLEPYDIYVAAGWKVYEEIKRILEQRGLKEYENFRWAAEYQKKVVVIHANCYRDSVQTFLSLSKKFRQEYVIHPVPYVYLNNENELSPAILMNCDVFIHQDIRVDNPFSYKLSDEYILPQLREDCLKITIPNLVGMGRWMFPQHKQDVVLRTIPMRGQNIFTYYKDSILTEAHDKKIPLQMKEYKKYYLSYSISAEMMQRQFDIDMQQLKEREKNWDIKISDFILNNMREHACFVDFNHPSIYVMKEINRQISTFLGLNDIKDKEYCMQIGMPTPVLPCIKKYFGMRWKTMDKRVFTVSDDEPTNTISDYIQAYMWWCYEEKIN